MLLQATRPRRPPGITVLAFLTLLCSASLLSCANDDAQPGDSQIDAAGASETGDARPATNLTGHDVEKANGRRASRASKQAEHAPRSPHERPIPAFSGMTLAGTRLSMRDLLGARTVLVFFNPEVAGAEALVGAVDDLAPLAGDHNFQLVGIGIGSDGTRLARFAKEQALAFPIVDDSGGQITQQLGLRTPLALIGVDGEGYMSFGMGNFPKDADLAAIVDDQLREHLRLPRADAGRASEGALYAYPKAPELGVVAMTGGATLETAELAGRAAIVIFFLHTCPHCHKALAAIEQTLAKLPGDKKPRLVAISLQNAPSAVRRSLADLDLDFFDPYVDPGEKASERWGVTGGVPVVSVLDAEGRILHRSQGWNEKRDPGMLQMQVARAAGARVPMLLDPTGFSGNDVCGTCHAQEFATWQFTQHATAFDTLVTHSADRRTDCVGCHVVGFEQTGGYDIQRRPAHLENVGCESCHGRGGPHLSPGFVPPGESDQERYAEICATCHNPTHSLGFEFGTFHPRVSHDRIASLSNAERADLLEGGGPSRDLLPTKADFVGSDRCQSCHTKEFETWQASPHAGAFATLEASDKANDAECLACHTTAFGRPGGFAIEEPLTTQADFARVGCESCHGPGGDHVGENARRVGTILSLGDKCDSCVILKICGSCHDDANDPGFEFEVEARIEAQRHGTIEAAATRDAEPPVPTTGSTDAG